MKLEHTPGPWKNHYGLIVNESQAAPVICSMFGKDEHDFHNSPANARLIAAAPDMLYELILIYQSSDNDITDEYCLDRWKTIIESATGKKIEEVLS